MGVDASGSGPTCRGMCLLVLLLLLVVVIPSPFPFGEQVVDMGYSSHRQDQKRFTGMHYMIGVNHRIRMVQRILCVMRRLIRVNGRMTIIKYSWR